MTESELVKKALAGDEACKERLVVQYRSLVYKLARPFMGTLGKDAVAIANLGFWKGVTRFDPSKGVLTTVVYNCIRGELLEEIRNGAPKTRSGKPRITEAWSLDEYAVSAELIQSRVDLEGDLIAKSVLDAIESSLDARRKDLLGSMLAGGEASVWSRANGVSPTRGQQLRDDIRDKARELLAA